MRHPVLSLLACATLASAATAQSASSTLFGASCTTSEGTPTLGNTGLPVLGRSFNVDYRGPNRFGGGVYDYRPHLVIGLNSFWPGVTIPQSLFPSQPVNCNLYVTHDLVIPMPLSTRVRPAYESSFTFSIPNDPTLQGASFFVQWITTYNQCGIIPPCWVPWIATSQAGIATRGT